MRVEVLVQRSVRQRRHRFHVQRRFELRQRWRVEQQVSRARRHCDAIRLSDNGEANAGGHGDQIGRILRRQQRVAPARPVRVIGDMAANGGGSIINIGSLYASVSPDANFYAHLAGNAPFIKSPAYGASKAAVVNMTKFFATHWAGRGIRVNTLSPGGVLAGQDEQFKSKYGARVPLARMAEPEDLKGPLIFLASSASSYVTGHELRVDGGFTA